MAGSSKRKSKKNKGKSNRNKPNTANKQHCDDSDVPKESENKSLAPTLSPSEDGGDSKCYNELMLEQELFKKVEKLYEKALEKMAALEYDMDIASMAILINGSIFGESNILENIVTNAIYIINSGHMTDGEFVFDREPIFKNMSELIKFSMQLLINMILKDRPDLQRSDAMLHLLSSDALVTDGRYGDCSHSKDENLDVEKLLKETTAFLKELDINNTPSKSTSVSPLVELSVSADSLSTLTSDFVKTLVNRPEEINLEELLKSGSDEQKNELFSILVEEAKTLEAQVEERKAWAKNRVFRANKKMYDDIQELMMLKSEKMEYLKKENEELADYSYKLSEKETSLKKVNIVYDRLDEHANRLEAQNQEIRANILAFELHASESEKAKQRDQKSEMKALKRMRAAEKQISEMQRRIEDEKQKILEVKKKLLEVNEANEQAKVKLQHEIEAKEHARAMFMEEQRLYRKAKEESKERLASLKRELDMEHQQQMDHLQRLRLELSQLKEAQDSSEAASSSHGTISRKCKICLENDADILFLPCAHEVMCSDCHENVYEVFQDHCPLCNTLIGKRIKVYGPS